MDATQIQIARRVPIEDEIDRWRIKLRRQGNERVGPRPRCGTGHDRFSINVRKQLWNCRGCGRGGNIIDLVMHLDRCSFQEAVRALVGDRPLCESRIAPACQIIRQ